METLDAHVLGSLCSMISLLIAANSQYVVPTQFQGDWFSIEHGDDIDTIINDNELIKSPGTDPIFHGRCIGMYYFHILNILFMFIIIINQPYTCCLTERSHGSSLGCLFLLQSISTAHTTSTANNLILKQ